MEMDGGRAGLKAGAGKTREAPRKAAERQQEKGKAQGSPAAASAHMQEEAEEDPTSSTSYSSSPACMLQTISHSPLLIKTTANASTTPHL